MHTRPSSSLDQAQHVPCPVTYSDENHSSETRVPFFIFCHSGPASAVLDPTNRWRRGWGFLGAMGIFSPSPSKLGQCTSQGPIPAGWTSVVHFIPSPSPLLHRLHQSSIRAPRQPCNSACVSVSVMTVSLCELRSRKALFVSPGRLCCASPPRNCPE